MLPFYQFPIDFEQSYFVADQREELARPFPVHGFHGLVIFLFKNKLEVIDVCSFCCSQNEILIFSSNKNFFENVERNNEI